MVDGSVFSEGDTINMCKITRITLDGVEYEKSGEIQYQSLKLTNTPLEGSVGLFSFMST